jgi:Xaa-Pro dipeptidase
MPQTPLAGETLIAGIGASVGGYHAESGAISSAGSMSIDQRCCLDAASASDVARKLALFPGASCTAANDAGLRPIREAGFDNFIRHRIGHGMGIQGHDAAWDAPGNVTAVAGFFERAWNLSARPRRLSHHHHDRHH